MIALHSLQNTRRRQYRRRVGRGPGSGMGKTCCRGGKGASARAGYKTRARAGYEGGQMRLFMKLPNRGFNNIRFNPKLEVINLGQIDRVFQDGEVVNEQSLRKYGFIGGVVHGIKVLGQGTLTKKVSFEVDALSDSAQQQLEKAKVSVKIKGAKDTN